MKKVIFTLALVSMFGLAACGEGAATNDSNDTNDTNTPKTVVENATEAAADVAAAATDAATAAATDVAAAATDAAAEATK